MGTKSSYTSAAGQFICSQNANVDRTLNFDMPLSRAVEERDTGSVVVKTTGGETQRFIVVMLAINCRKGL